MTYSLPLALERPSITEPTVLARLRPILQGIGGVVIGAGGMMLLMRIDGALTVLRQLGASLGDYPMLSLLGITLLALLGAVAVHECGHALTGRVVGFRFLRLFVGPLAIVREGARVRVRVGRTPILVGGLSVSVPTASTSDAAFVRAFAWYVAGGPIASLGLAIGALLASTSVGGGAQGSLLGIALFCLGVISLLLLALSIVPAQRPGGFASDGAQLLRLYRDPHASAVISALGLAGQVARPRDWDASLVARLAGITARPLAISGRALAYHHALDVGDVERARDELQSLISIAFGDRRPAASRLRTQLRIEAAMFEALWRGDASAARRWLGISALAPTGDEATWHLATGAIAMLKGDRETARDSLVRAESVLARAPLPSAVLIRASCVERMRGAIQGRSTPRG